jgi:hypothetical protein
MNLTETYNRLILDNFWKEVEVSYMSSEVSIPPKLGSLLTSANDLVFKRFNISPSDKNYFVAGSARLHLDPKIKKLFNLKGKIGDLDVVISDKGAWSKSIFTGKLPKEEVFVNQGSGWVSLAEVEKKNNLDERGVMEVINSSKLAYRPMDNKVIEVFDEWNPALGGEEYADTKVRSTKEIMHDSVNLGGYNFMNIGDVIDYKLKMNREKEKDIVNLINDFRAAPYTDKNVDIFFKKLVDLVGEQETKVVRSAIN